MQWKLIAQTKAYKDLNDEYQLFFYEYVDDAVTFTQRIIDLTKDRFNLKRGSSSVKDKFTRILNTQIDFSIYDLNRWLQNELAGKPESSFKGILKKNGNNFFIGHITQYLSPYDFTKPNTILKLKLYDGLTRLKDMRDYSSFSADTDHLSSILFNLLNYLPFELNLYIYTNLYRNAQNPAYHIGIKINDYLAIKPSASYYDILDMILTQFQFRLFQEGGYWHIQQVLSMVSTDPPIYGVIREYITAAGSQSATRISVKQSFAVSELKWAPQEFDVDPISEIDLTVRCYGPKDIPFQRAQKEFLQWYNPFLTNDYGWTVDAGTVRWADGALQIDPGGQVSQVSGQLSANEIIILSFSVLCVRMVLANADRLDHTLQNQNPLFEVQYLGDNGTTYYLRRDNLTWDTEATVWNKFGIDIFGFDVWNYDTNGFIYSEEYSSPSLKKDYELPTPLATSGKIKVLLYGGAAPTQNTTTYPYQITAQHNYFNVQRKKINNNPNSVVPNNFNVYSHVDNPVNIKSIDIPFHDKDPYVNPHLWEWIDDPYDLPNRFVSCNGNWSPAGKPLLQYMAEELVQFNVECNKGIDVTFLRGKTISFTNLFQGDIYSTGTDRFYLPCYEESDLIADTRRFLCLLHEKKSYSLTTRYKYESNDLSTNETTNTLTSNSPGRIVYPEDYGAIGNGITDDTNAITNAFRAAVGKEIQLTKDSYLISSKISIDLNGETLKINSNIKSKLISTANAVTNNYYIPEAVMEFKNGSKIVISGFDIDCQKTSSSFLNGIMVSGINDVAIENVNCKNAGYAGIRVLDANQLNVSNCNCTYNLYAGLLVHRTKHVTIFGGTYSYNGKTPPVDGYGIAISHEYGVAVDNEDVSIIGVAANYNLRKGIDVHGGVGVMIADCMVKGFVYGGIYAVNEGANEANHLKHVADCIIHHNIVENDTAWFEGLTFGNTPDSHPVQFGSYNDLANIAVPSGGSWICESNIIKNCNVSQSGTNYLKYPIQCFGGTAKIVLIKNNIIEDANCENGILIGSGNDSSNQPEMVEVTGNNITNVTAQRIILINAGSKVRVGANPMLGCTATSLSDSAAIAIFPYGTNAVINYVDIDGGQMQGNFNYGIKLNSISQFANVKGLDLIGTISNPISIDTDITFKTSKNTFNKIALPEYDMVGVGKLEYSLAAGDVAPNIIDIATIDVSIYNDDAISFNIEIHAVRYSCTQNGIFKFIATAGRVSDGTLIFNVDKDEFKTSLNSYADIEPTLSWVGSGSSRILRASLPAAWTTYHINVDVAGWRVTTS